ncbi:MAG: hypothetical protein ACFFDR_09785 [Candidatus Thorarchaeota archaeon]
MKPPTDEIIEVDWKAENPKVTLALGETFRCRFHRHGSVGEDAEFEIGDTSIIAHEDTKAEYTHPEHMKKPDWTGGDAERAYWDFKAVGKGETILTVKVLFRFDVESEHSVKVIVR